MTRHTILRSPAVNKKQPLLASEESTTSSIAKLPLPSGKTAVAAAEKRKGKKVGEVAGGAAAECAAVCCCCPCAVVNLLLLAVYRFPTAVCKKAWRRRKRRRFAKKRQGLLAAVPGEDGSQTSGPGRLNVDDPTAETESDENDASGEQKHVVDLEKEMWDRFYGAGFWRSPSQRDTS